MWKSWDSNPGGLRPETPLATSAGVLEANGKITGAEHGAHGSPALGGRPQNSSGSPSGGRRRRARAPGRGFGTGPGRQAGSPRPQARFPAEDSGAAVLCSAPGCPQWQGAQGARRDRVGRPRHRRAFLRARAGGQRPSVRQGAALTSAAGSQRPERSPNSPRRLGCSRVTRRSLRAEVGGFRLAAS